MTCPWKMRPFPNPTEIQCRKDDQHPEATHEAVLRNYAYPGSETMITWQATDRREFTGDWPGTCGDNDAPCVLPRGHRGRHAA